MSTRDQHVLAYAEYLHSDPALWRITITYMYSCREVGKQQADEILLRVPLRLHEQPESNAEHQIKAGDVVGVLKDVVETCSQYNREAVRRTVCRVSQEQSSTTKNDMMNVLSCSQIAAQTLVQEKDYGLAVSYCASAEDWPGLGRIVDRVLEEYITGGKVFNLAHRIVL